MQAPKRTDEEIINAMQGNKVARDEALRYVFEKLGWKSMVIAYIVQRGGNEADAEEVANDALVAFDKNIRSGKFKGGSALETYFISIAKYKWLNQQRGKKVTDEFNPQKHEIPTGNIEDAMISEEKIKYLELATAVLGEKCQRLFRLKQWDYPGDAIAEEMGWENANMVKKAYYRCRQKFVEYLNENPNWKDLIN